MSKVYAILNDHGAPIAAFRDKVACESNKRANEPRGEGSFSIREMTDGEYTAMVDIHEYLGADEAADLSKWLFDGNLSSRQRKSVVGEINKLTSVENTENYLNHVYDSFVQPYAVLDAGAPYKSATGRKEAEAIKNQLEDDPDAKSITIEACAPNAFPELSNNAKSQPDRSRVMEYARRSNVVHSHLFERFEEKNKHGDFIYSAGVIQECINILEQEDTRTIGMTRHNLVSLVLRKDFNERALLERGFDVQNLVQVLRVKQGMAGLTTVEPHKTWQEYMAKNIREYGIYPESSEAKLLMFKHNEDMLPCLRTEEALDAALEMLTSTDLDLVSKVSAMRTDEAGELVYTPESMEAITRIAGSDGPLQEVLAQDSLEGIQEVVEDHMKNTLFETLVDMGYSKYDMEVSFDSAFEEILDSPEGAGGGSNDPITLLESFNGYNHELVVENAVDACFTYDIGKMEALSCG